MSWCVFVAIFAQFSPAGPEAVFIAASLASVLRDVRTDGWEKRSLTLKRNGTDPLPDSLSWGPPSNWLFQRVPAPTNPPPSTHCPPSPHLFSGHTLITEFPGNCPNRLPRVAMFWTQVRVTPLDRYQVNMLCQHVDGEKQIPICAVESRNKQQLCVCLVNWLCFHLSNCQIQGCWIVMLELGIFSLRPQMDCFVPVEQSVQMTHWLIYYNKSCCTDTNGCHLCSFPSLSLVFSGQKKSSQKSAWWSFLLMSGQSFFLTHDILLRHLLEDSYE